MEKGSSNYIIIVTNEQGSRESLKVTSRLLPVPKHGELVKIDDEGHMGYVTDIYTPEIGPMLVVKEESVLDRKMRTRPPGSPVTFW